MKYLGMICRGHLPCIARHKVHPESKKFLQLFLAKGEPPDRGNLLKAARGLHLAFKDMQTEEIYAVLTEWLIYSIKRYDPFYKDKIRLVVNVINKKLAGRKYFETADVNHYLDFDCNRHLHLWRGSRDRRKIHGTKQVVPETSGIHQQIEGL